LHAKDDDGNTLPWIKMSESGKPLNLAWSWRLDAQWEPEEELSLNTFIPKTASLFERGMDRYQQEKRWDTYGTGAAMPQQERIRRLEMLALYSHLKPPVYQKQTGKTQSPSSHDIIRHGGRRLDFASWFGRPCIIVMGFVKDAALPISLHVDGEEINHSSGMTMVRWVYPLGTAP